MSDDTPILKKLAGQESNPLTSYAEDSPAKTSPLPVSAKASRASGQDSGANTSEPFAHYDPVTSSWKTFQVCLTQQWDVFSETWPTAGMMRSGKSYRLLMSAHRTFASASGLWRTPSAQLAGEGPLLGKLVTKEGEPAKRGERAYNPITGKHVQITLNREVKMWPTPSVTTTGGPTGLGGGSGNKAKLKEAGLEKMATGALNPTWVEWLMGFPTGHTALEP